MQASGEFEICESGSLVVSGKIRQVEEQVPIKSPVESGETSYELTSSDVYKELRLRGYDYGPDFRGIHRADIDGRLLTCHKGNVA